MRKASIITLGLLGVLFLIGLFFYNKFGGFNLPEIKVITSEKCMIVGKEYSGKLTSKEFGKLFENAEAFIKEGKLKGQIGGIFYSSPEKTSDSIIAFIGVVVKDSLNDLPDGYSLRTLDSRKVIQAHIKAHILVAPDIYPDIEEYAKENKIKSLKVPALEIYPSNEEMFIEVPVE